MSSGAAGGLRRPAAAWSIAAIDLDDLRQIDLFEDLGDVQLGDWLGVAAERRVAPGAIVAEQGEAPPGLILVLDGTLESLVVDGARTEPAGRSRAPTWTAAVAVITGEPMAVRLQALTEARIALVPPEDTRRLAFATPEIHRRMMHVVAPLLGRIARVEVDRERLASLGTMAAGLAHELNNPASAARRSALRMAEALEVLSGGVGNFAESGLTPDDVRALVAMQHEAVALADAGSAPGGLDAADAEDRLLEQLEARGIPEPWALTEELTACGLDAAWVDRVGLVAGPATGIALEWIVATLAARRLAGELEEASGRISDLVSAVEAYAYMDRGGLVEVDVHEGLDATLTVLAHKLRPTAIRVVRDYAPGLPTLTAHGAELNQAWTNLLDNAIDALGERGTIGISTRRDGTHVEVAISDDGPGVPPEIRPHVFDDFFTTKDVGRGSGLGLATARRIIVDRHDGSLSLESRPGATTFTVRLPLDRT